MNQRTFSILGDSISTFQGYNPQANDIFYPREGHDVIHVEETWWHILASRNNLTLVANESYSGSRISRTGVRPLSSCFADEVRQAPLAGSIIIVFGGTNDWGQLEQPTTLEIFTEAYRNLVTMMVSRHRDSTLYFCTPLQRTDRSLESANVHGWTQLDLAQIIRSTVASTPGANLIELATYPITHGDGLLADGVHPTKAGMRVLATLMEKGLALS